MIFASTLHSLFAGLNNSARGITFIQNSKDDLFIPYKEIYQNSLLTLGALQNLGVKPDDELVFQIKNPKSFIEIFWACILGRIVPVPINFAATTELKEKLKNVLKVLNSPYLITSRENYNKNLFLDKELISLLQNEVILSDEIKLNTFGQIQEASSDDIAYIQFSSGSTGSPKGVMLTHSNLLTNIESIHCGINSPEEGDKFFSWMPLTHDMGLIGFHLTPMAKGWNHYIMPTELFMRNPSLWLNKISEYKITFTSSPNFGYQYILKHFNPEKNPDIDLSSLRIIVNGAEPISKDICLKFNEYFKDYGLKANAIFPVYGLAEASLAVSFSDVDEEISSTQVGRNNLNIGDQITLIEDDESSINFVSVGKPVENTEIRIVDVESNPLGETFVGKIQIKGGNVTSGYYNNRDATKILKTNDGWLNTGDLGFQDVDGNLYIVGRDKDILFVNGVNFYSHDLERIAEKVPEIELGKIVVTADFNDDLYRDEIVAFVLYRGKLENFLFIKKECEKVISEETGIHLDHVVPVKRIPKTTSGKVQRYRLLKEYLDGEYDDVKNQIECLERNIKSIEIALPETESEEKILKLWKRILEKEDISIYDDFFVLGGNSLKAGQLLMSLQEEIGLDVLFEELYGIRTIKGLSELIKHNSSKYSMAIERCNSVTIGLSHAQSRIFYHYQLNKKSIAYNIPQVFTLEGTFNVGRINSALFELINRYDILRTTFHIKSGVPYQKIHEESVVSLEEMILDQKINLDEQIRKYILPFNLEELPLIKIKYGFLSPEKAIVLIDIHHVIADGSSLINLIDALFSIYNGKDFKKPEIQYADCVLWEEKHLRSNKTDAAKEYWRECLQGNITQLNLPTDFSRTVQDDDNGARVFGSLGTDLHSSLELFSKDIGISKSTIFLSCYSILLHKLTSQEDIIIGMAESGRNHVKFLDTIGMFVNNLPIRFFPDGNIGINQYLSAINKNLIQALDNKSLPYNELLNILDLKTIHGRNPLFDTMFIYQNMDFPELSSDDLKIIHHRFDPKTSKFDITLEIFENDALDFAFEYSSELFTEETITRFSGYFKEIVKAVIDNQVDKIKDIEILSNVERKNFLTDYNSTNSDTPSLLVHELFEKQAKETPDSFALIFKEDKLTYYELDQKATKLASVLIGKGLEPDDFVVLLADRSFEFIISVLGVLKAGGAYVPVDPSYPSSRKEYIIEDSKAKLIIASKEIIESNKSILNNFDRDCIIHIDRLASYEQTRKKNTIKASSTNLAYMIYTSGTSGQPKGVMIEHRNLMNYIWWAKQVYVKGEPIDFPLFTSVSFDLTVTSVFLPLITGNTLHIYNEDDQSLLIQLVIHDDKVGVIKLTPSHLRLIKADHTIKAENINNLKRFVVGGEDLTADLAKEILNKFKGQIEIYNEYGPTEATVGCMTYRFDSKKRYSKSVPIGKPSNNSKIFILDKYLKPVALGVVGEMFIGGDSVARGYLNKDALTQEKFVLIPELSDSKIYRTGDFANFIDNEILEFCGRFDQQIKLNGYRIELDEIELCMQEVDGVTNAVVSKVNHNGTDLLCAYYVSEDGLEEALLRDYLQKRLPPYMVPSLFFNTDEIPLSPNGKVDKDALPKIDEVKRSGEYKIAENEIQKLLVDIFQDVLNNQKVGIDDNFFELGGDSIKAVQITSRLYDKGISLNVNDILSYQTISKISFYTQKSVREYEQGLVSGKKELSPIEGWFFEQNFENPNYYNQSVLLEFKDKIDKNILEQVFEKLIEHHDGLRINYNQKKGCLYFNNEHLNNPFTIEVFEIDEENDLELIGIKLKSSFDITDSLLIKAGIIKENNNPDRLLITAHHLVIDGVSWRILLEDLYNFYQALVKDDYINVPLKSGSLLDWYNALTEYSNSKELKTQVGYWNEIDNTEFNLSDETKIQPVTDLGSERSQITIDKEQTEFLLKDANKPYNTDIQILLITALLITMKEYTEKESFTVEMENYGRNIESVDVSRTLGWFTVIYPIGFEVDGDDIGVYIKHIKEQIRNVPEKGIGYGITKYLNKKQESGKKEKSEIRFNYLGQFGKEISNDLFSYLNDFSGKEISDNNHLTTNLDVNSLIINGELNIELIFNKCKYNEYNIALINENFEKNIERLTLYLSKENDIHFTPSDFDTVELDEEDLKVLFQ